MAFTGTSLIQRPDDKCFDLPEGFASLGPRTVFAVWSIAEEVKLAAFYLVMMKNT